MTHSDQQTSPYRLISALLAVAFVVAIGVSQSREGLAATGSTEVSELNDPGSALQQADRLGLVTTTTEAPPTTEAPKVTPPPDGKLIFPLAPASDCYVNDSFGDPRGSRSHEGIDIMGSYLQPVYAVASGQLTQIYTDSGLSYGAGNGWKLVDEENNVTYKFFHLDSHEEGLSVGDNVALGDVIGYVGDTGTSGTPEYPNNHLHFEVRPNNYPVDPLPLVHINRDVCGVG
jgi:murein DD-endopeptidase MepM/ murein hydrolase activator NlpD